MLSYSSLHGLHTGALSLPDLLTQVEQRYEECEASVQALIPEENRFVRLSQDADAILADFPDPSERPPLYGALVGAKDIFHVEGFATQAGSRLPVEVLQGKQAESVTRLKNAGALILGKTVTTEFAYFSPGPTRNPHNPEHTPGGSSSGSAAAVAAGYCHIALGTQTIGSIIRPASFCGVVGVKPTYERISRQGVIPLSPSLDHVGFFAPDVDTAIQAAKVLYNDFNERTQLSKKPRLGIPDGPYLEKTSRDGIKHFEQVCKELERAGYSVQRIPMMLDLVEIISRHHVIMSAEAAQVHAEWFDAYETLYSAKLVELIRRGQAVTSDQLQGALAAQNEFRAEMRKAFSGHDIDFWICPSTVGAAPKGLESTGDPILNLPWTQAGLPTMNLPAGKNEEGLPLGLQIVGNWYMDESLLFSANDLEKVLSTL